MGGARPDPALVLLRLPLIALVFGLALAAPAAAQDGPAGGVLTLDEALGLALGRNLDLAQSATTVALAGVDVSLDEAAYQPTLSVSASPAVRYSRSGTAGFVDSTGAVQGSGSGVSLSLSLGVQSDLTVFDAGLRRNNLAQSRALLASSEASYTRAEEQTLYQAATQYLSVLQSEALVGVYEEAIAAQVAQLDLVEASYEAGNRSLADVLQQRASIAQARQSLVTAEQNVALALLDLKRTLRLDAAAEVDVAPVDTAAADADPALDAVVLAARAAERRSDVAAQRLQVDAAEAAVDAARSGFYPTVSLGASAGTDYASGAGGLGTQLFDSRPTAGLSLGVSLPIFDRRQTRSAVERARISVESQRLELASAEQQVSFETEEAVLAVDATAARLDAAEAQVAAAAEALDAAQERYRVGAGTFAELTDARALLVDARGQAAQARYQSLIDRVALGYAIGDLLPALDALR